MAVPHAVWSAYLVATLKLTAWLLWIVRLVIELGYTSGATVPDRSTVRMSDVSDERPNQFVTWRTISSRTRFAALAATAVESAVPGISSFSEFEVLAAFKNASNLPVATSAVPNRQATLEKWRPAAPVESVPLKMTELQGKACGGQI